eukprot:3101775-Pyramimonas_sp.AAC.3
MRRGGISGGGRGRRGSSPPQLRVLTGRIANWLPLGSRSNHRCMEHVEMYRERGCRPETEGGHEKDHTSGNKLRCGGHAYERRDG